LQPCPRFNTFCLIFATPINSPAALYKAWCSLTIPFAIEKFALIADYLPGLSFEDNITIEEKANSVIDKIEQFMKMVEVNHRIRDFGLSQEMCSQMVDEVEGNLTLDPGDTSKETIKKIYHNSW